MAARQQVARLAPLALLVVLAIAGLRGVVPAPRWTGPLRAEGVAVGIALEVVLGVLLVLTVRRDRAATRAAAELPSGPLGAAEDVGTPAALRFVLRWVLGGSMVAVAAVLLSNLHAHFLTQVTFKPLRLPRLPPRHAPPPTRGGGGAGTLHIPFGPILYGLLIAVLLAAVVVSIWWAARLRRAAAAAAIPDDLAEDSAGLRDAVESGRAALASQIDDARAAIIACYLAMERTLAERGAARAAADTPDELLARAVTSGIVRGFAARRLTALFYEARFSSHRLGREQRDTASEALDELAADVGDVDDAGTVGTVGTGGASRAAK